jgi:ribosome-associated heat shock protein Hsp15
VRIDDYLSTVFLIKRRTIAKEWILGGKVKLNGTRIKPSHDVKIGDKIQISYSRQSLTVEVAEVPFKSVPKKDAEKYYKQISTEQV